jgi:hypothetical protein
MQDFNCEVEEVEEEETFCCEQCNRDFPDDESRSFCGDLYCEDCFDSLFDLCADCQNVYLQATRRGTDENGDEVLRVSTGEYVCHSCRVDFYCCLSCDEYYRGDDMNSGYCDGCADSMNSSSDYSNYVHSYSYKPWALFHGNKPRESFGVELEVVIDMDTAEDISDMSHGENLFYLKEDGSVAGYEVVTHPCSLDYHINSFPWASLCGALSRAGGKSHNTDSCGLHVHVSRDTFTEAHIARFVAFINIHEDWFTIFARRNSNQWALYKKNGFRSTSQRYEAVNLQNRGTIEVRIFKGTLKPDTIKAAIQLVDAVKEFTRHSSIADICNNTDKNLDKFKRFVGASAHAELKAYCIRKQLIV